MIFTNEMEKIVYNVIKESNEQFTFETLKKIFGNNVVGTIGKLKQRNLVEIVKQFRPELKKSIKTIKIKEVK